MSIILISEKRMGKIGSIVRGNREGTKRTTSQVCPNQSLKEENACIAIVINDRVENNNNDTNKDPNGNNNNNNMETKGKTSIGKISLKPYVCLYSINVLSGVGEGGGVRACHKYFFPNTEKP